MMRFLACLLLVTAIVGCGYAKSGTWDDDAGNWERVFGEEKPDSVVLVHSRYWRGPHFTMEFAYFLEIEKNTDLQARLFKNNKLRRLEGDAASSSHFGEKPAWFLPKSTEDYDVWTYEDPPRTFRLFIDRETGEIFMSDYQV